MGRKPGNEEDKCSFKYIYDGPDHYYPDNLFPVQRWILFLAVLSSISFTLTFHWFYFIFNKH